MSFVTLLNAKQFPCAAETTLLEAARAHGIVLEHSCRAGRCGVCKARVISGNTKVIKSEESLSVDELSKGYILTCARSAIDNVVLETEDLGQLASIKTQTLPCRIEIIQKISPDVIHVSLRLPPKSTFDFRSGQYIDIIAKGGVRRSYSIASARSASDNVELHIRHVRNGEMSKYWFNEAKENDLLRFEGPHGTFCFREKPENNVIFLATGTGIAPIKSILEELNLAGERVRDKNFVVYWGGRLPQDIYWRPRFESISVTFHPILSQANEEWTGRRGYVQDAVIADNVDLSSSIVYACGSDAMINSAQQRFLSCGLAKNNFYSDAFVSSK